MQYSILGFVFAFASMISWAVGDFFIQKSIRLVGNWKTLFFITSLGTVGIFPFIIPDLPAIFGNLKNFSLLLFLSGITLVVALLLFEGLKRGKLAIIEPIFGLELIYHNRKYHVRRRETSTLYLRIFRISTFRGGLDGHKEV